MWHISLQIFAFIITKIVWNCGKSDENLQRNLPHLKFSLVLSVKSVKSKFQKCQKLVSKVSVKNVKSKCKKYVKYMKKVNIKMTKWLHI